MNLKEEEKENLTNNYVVCFSENEYISVKNALNAMAKMFLSMPTHRKANKEKATLLKEIVKNKFSD